MATNKVVYGNDTLIDLTSDTVDAAHLHNGYTAHDRSGTAITGSYVAPTITQITPSNASPVSMSANTAYEPTTSGYAIESYENLIPSNSDPQTIEIGEIYKATNNGKAVASVTEVDPYEPDFMGRGGIYTPTDNCFAIANSLLTTITPSNSSPATITSGKFHDAQGNGYAIASYNNVTPSDSSPVALTSGDIDKMGGNGYAIESYPSVLPPSDSSPATITNGTIYKAVGSGYAIKNEPESLAPSNSSPASISSGTIYKASANGKAVASITDLLPSNNLPKTITAGEIYKASGSGVAIYTYENKTPSSSGTQFNAGFVKMSSGGYAYDAPVTPGPAAGTGTFTSTSQEVSISTGVSSISHFVIHIYPHTVSSNDITSFATWDSSYSSYYYAAAVYTATASQGQRRSVGTAASGAYLIGIMSISGGTVSIKGPSATNGLGTYVWFAY